MCLNLTDLLRLQGLPKVEIVKDKAIVVRSKHLINLSITLFFCMGILKII
jgi:hypothetical protein